MHVCVSETHASAFLTCHEMRAEGRVIRSINELAYCLSIVADVLLVLMAV